jgi:hypothetical protein
MNDPHPPDAEARARMQARNAVLMNDFEQVALPELPDVPSQISPGEARYLYWLVRDGYVGRGAIVELDTWPGRSTLCLAAGLRDSGRPGRIESFDNFEWAGKGDSIKSGIELGLDDDFMVHFLANIEPMKEWIGVHRADFLDMNWPADRPIEILFVDGPKTTQLLSSSLTALTAALVPGETTIVFQDYQHPLSYDVPLAVHRLRERLALRQSVASGGTVSFLLTSPIPASELAAEELGAANWGPERVKRAWEEILEPLEGPVRNRLTSASALHLCATGLVDEALARLRQVRFDKRLHMGWQNWRQSGTIYGKYRPLFDYYADHIQPAAD